METYFAYMTYHPVDMAEFQWDEFIKDVALVAAKDDDERRAWDELRAWWPSRDKSVEPPLKHTCRASLVTNLHHQVMLDHLYNPASPEA